MIDFERLEREAAVLAARFRDAAPFAHVVIDDFCHAAAAEELAAQIPSPADGAINKSRDYVFARNKFEKSNFRELGPRFEEIYADLMSDRFKAVLQAIVAAPVWVDPDFHGGGIHQGGEGSFLDMHVDFSHHPLHAGWERELNILLYLNPDWQPAYGGALKLRHRHSGDAGAIAPLFNRCVVMQTKDHTLHGYDRLTFPAGTYRRSIATYAYRTAQADAASRSTVWYPAEGSAVKRLLGRNWPRLVRWKGKLLGSGTARNR